MVLEVVTTQIEFPEMGEAGPSEERKEVGLVQPAVLEVQVFHVVLKTGQYDP